MASGFVTAAAPQRAQVDACIQCGLCLPHCPTYRLTGQERYSPRGRLSAMSAVLEGIATVDEAFDDALSTCLGCRACEAVCPGLVPYGPALEGVRAEITTQRPNIGRRVRRVLLGRGLGWRGGLRGGSALLAFVQRARLGVVMPASVRRTLSGVRPLDPGRRGWAGRSVASHGAARGKVVLLTGCVMDQWFGPVHDATVGVLTRAGYEVVAPASQTCCGALAAHDGHTADARRLAQANLEALSGADLVVSDSAGCTAHLKEYGHWAPGGEAFAAGVRDVTELVAELIDQGALPEFPPSGMDVAIQDPCHLRHVQRIVDQPRRLVRAAGYTPVEIDPDGLCCGAAGIYSILQPEASHQLGARKADQVVATGAALVASANPGCEMQLRSHLGGAYRVVHPIELYWESLARGGAPSNDGRDAIVSPR